MASAPPTITADAKRLRRDSRGRFAASTGTHVDSKGYLTISSGPLRGMRLHRLVALAKWGPKALQRDSVIHHKDGNKKNPHPDNLELMGERQHNAVSAKQAWFFKKNDIELKNEYDQYFSADTSFTSENLEI